MKSTVETLSPTRVRLTVEVPFEELKPSLDETYREIAKQITIPGFRKGKVPAPIIDQRIGRPYVLEQAVNGAIPRLYLSALEENKVQPLTQPEVDVREFSDGSDLTFTAELDVVPEITLPEYTGLEVTVDAVEVTDEDVDKEIEALRERFGSLETVERAAADGDYVTIDLSASKDGEPVEDAQAKGMSYKIGSGALLEGLDEAVIGLSAGESRTFVSRLVSGPRTDEDMDITVTVQAVKEQKLPDLDDDFAQLASEFDTLEDLRADTRETLLRRARVRQANEAREAVLRKLLEVTEVPVPEKFVEQQIQARRNAIRRQLEQIGMTEEQYFSSQGQSQEEFENEMRTNVVESTKTTFILDAIAEKEEFPIAEEEFGQHLMMRAQQSQQDPNEFLQHAIQHNHLPEYMAELRRSKALKLLVDEAVVTDPSGERVELARLRPDGTYAPEDEEPRAEDDADDAETDDAAEAGDGRSGEKESGKKGSEEKSDD